MKDTESLTRVLPGNPTEIFTPEAVEMPFDAFGRNLTTPAAGCKEKAED